MRFKLLFSLVLIASCAQATPPGADDDSSRPDAGIPDKQPDAGGLDREINCIDGLDDDNDGLRDCADPDCAGVAQCTPESDCANGLDDNANGATDCADAGCDGEGFCEAGAERSCTDGNDNDGDGMTDCADPDCAGPACIPETNCANGLDDEGDGVADCADFDCDGVGTCEYGAEASCTDGLDNDADGLTDCNDPDCAVLAQCVIVCPAGSTALAQSGTGLPMMIPDFSVIQDAVTVGAAGTVQKTLVRINLPHEFTGDLAVSLEAPDGTSIDLTSGNGGFGAGFIETIFDDDAAPSITSGISPYTGRFRPEQPLSDLLGRGAAGSWTLAVDDQALFWVGQLDAWTLYLCVCEGPDCERDAACSDGVDNDGDGATDCDDSGCADEPHCVPESDCSNGVDDDLDGATDCADSDCSATVLCTAEGDCGDGLDDDGDGLIDCEDPGCAVGCEIAESTCNDGLDNDGDGLADCADSHCGVVCAAPACPAGQIAYALRAGDLPAAINDSATTTSRITTTRGGMVSRVAVRLSIYHTYVGDLDISLTAPDSTSIMLSNRNGGAGDDYLGTLFHDAAGFSIIDGAAPFDDDYAPEQSLSAATGQPAAGDWELVVYDSAGGDTGTVEAFELALCLAP